MRIERITLAGLRFHGRIGILPHERELAQPLEVDVTVWREVADSPGARAVLDYRDLHAVVADVAQHDVDYLEAAAHAIAEAAVRLPGVQRARVALRKPHVALPSPLAYAEVAVEVARDA